MKLFNNHSGLRGPPCFAEGIYWATGSSLTTPFTEGCPGVNDKASPPGRHQEQAPKQRCTFRPTTFSSVQCRSCGRWCVSCSPPWIMKQECFLVKTVNFTYNAMPKLFSCGQKLFRSLQRSLTFAQKRSFSRLVVGKLAKG